MEEEQLKYACTDGDMWNSADELHWYIVKGQVKPLPEEMSPIMEDAFKQGLLREPTEVEMSKYHFEKRMELALRERKFEAGNNYEGTLKNYQKYLDSIELEKVEEKPLPGTFEDMGKELKSEPGNTEEIEKEEYDLESKPESKPKKEDTKTKGKK